MIAKMIFVLIATALFGCTLILNSGDYKDTTKKDVSVGNITPTLSNTSPPKRGGLTPTTNE